MRRVWCARLCVSKVWHLQNHTGGRMQQQPRAAHNFDSVAALLASSGAGERSTPQRQSVSRNAALLLELRLIDAPALAPGSLLAAVQEQLQTWSITAQQQLKQDVQHDRTPTQASTTLAELLQTRLAPWQARLADIAQQLAQQVAIHCAEHGRSVAALQERSTELADAMFLVAKELSTHQDMLSTAVAEAAASASAAQAEAAGLRERLAAATAAGGEATTELQAARALSEQVQQDSELSVALLHRQLAACKQQLYKERQQHEQHVIASAVQAEAAEAAAHARLAGSENDLLRLRERLEFTEGRVAALREQLALPPPATCCTAAQTDTACSQPEGDACPPLDVAVRPEASSSGSEDDAGSGTLLAELLLPEPVELRQLVGQGRIRGQLWLLQQIAQLTADRAAADAAFIAGRQGVSCAGWADFVLGWSRTRLGLRRLASSLLCDLATSIAHHAGRGLLPAVWIARMCGGLSSGAATAVQQQKQQQPSGCCLTVGCGPLSPDAATLLTSPQAAGFWVFAACQLAFPTSVTALFVAAPETASSCAVAGGPLVAGGGVQDSLRAVFRRLEGDGPVGSGSSLMAAFIAHRLPAAAADECHTAPPSSGHVVYYAWSLLGLLMEEWLRHQAQPPQS